MSNQDTLINAVAVAQAANETPATVDDLRRTDAAYARTLAAHSTDPDVTAWGASRGLLPRTLERWGMAFVDPRVVSVGFGPSDHVKPEHIGDLTRAGLLVGRRRTEFVERTPTNTKHDHDAPKDHRPDLKGCRWWLSGRIAWALRDHTGLVRSFQGRWLDDAKTLRGLAGDFEADEEFVGRDPDELPAKYLSLKKERHGKSASSSVETSVYPLQLSPLFRGRCSGLEFKDSSAPKVGEDRPKRSKYDKVKDKTSSIWIPEGYLDGVAVDQAGVSSVALGGCETHDALIKELVRLLEPFAEFNVPIYLCLDADPPNAHARGKRIALGAGQRGACELLAKIRARDPEMARLIRVVDLSGQGEGEGKMDLADLLREVYRAHPRPNTGDVAADLLALEAWQDAVVAAQAAKLRELEAGAVDGVTFAVGLLEGVEAEDRTNALKETGFYALAAYDQDLWFARSELVGEKLGISKKDIPAWAKKVAKAGEEAAAVAEAKAKVEADDPLERFRGKDGSIFPCWRSAVAILEEAYKGKLRWNEMGLKPVIQSPDGELLKFGAAQFAAIRMRMSDEWGCHVRKQDLEDAVGDVARGNPIHPARDWFRALPPWEGKDCIPDLLEAMGLTEMRGVPRDRLRLYDAYLRKTNVALVARVMSPGCQVDTMLVLLGEQGIRKSSLLRALLPRPEWYGSAGRLDPSNKDAIQAIHSKVLLEVAEIDKKSFYGAESEWKDLISTPVDMLRPPYTRDVEDYARSSIFIGTSNAKQFLTDATGNRRFLPVELNFQKLKGETIDLAKVEKIREQMWAQALATYDGWVSRGSKKSECPWWLDAEEDKIHATDVLRHKLDDLDADKLRGWLDGQTSRTVTGVEICDSIHWDRSKYGKRISQWMESLGWTKSHTKAGATYTAPEEWRPGAGGLAVHTGGTASPEVMGVVTAILSD